MSEEAVAKATAALTKSIQDAAVARVEAEQHRRDADNFTWAADHRRACENARVALEKSIEAAANHLRSPQG